MIRMSRSAHRFATFVVVVWSLHVNADELEQSDPASPPAAHMSARGVVIDADGNRRPGVRVIVRAASTPAWVGLVDFPDVIAEMTTDEQGCFAFDKVPVASILDETIEHLQRYQRGAEVIALADGFGLSWAPLYTLENAAEVSLTLRSAAVVEGRVATPDGKPVADAELTVTGISDADAPYDPVGSGPRDLRLYHSQLRPVTKTDNEGRFRIGGLPVDSRVSLGIVHPEYSGKFLIAVTGDFGSKSLSHERGGEERQIELHSSPISVVLETGLRLRVRVAEEEDRAAVPQGRITLIQGGREWTTKLNASGRASLAINEPGDYHLLYFSPDLVHGFAVSRKLALTAAHATEPYEYEFRLPRRRILQGRVVGKRSETGPESLGVRFYHPSGNGDFTAKTNTGRDGQFSMEVMPGEGHVFLDGKVPGYFVPDSHASTFEDLKQFAVSVHVPLDGLLPPVRLEVSRGLIARGTVRSADGQPTPGAIVRAVEVGRYGARYVETVASSTGRYEILGLNPRESYELRAGDRGYVATTSVPGAPSHGWTETREVELDLDLKPTVTMRGRVLFQERPLAKVRVELSRGHTVDGNGTRYQPVDEALTDLDGRYTLTGVRPGDLYQIELTPPFLASDPEWRHGSPYVLTVPASDNLEMALPDAHLVRRNQTIAGIVVDPDGKPVAGATVSASLQGGGQLSRPEQGPPPWTETGADGKFRLTQLPEAPLELMAYIRPKGTDRRIRFPARVTCELNQQNIRILLDPSLLED